MVLLFPFRVGSECNRASFVSMMLGLRTELLNGRAEEFVDEAKRFFHTDRCYMNLNGTPNVVLEKCAKIIETAQHESERLKARSRRRDEMKRVLEEEYTGWTGSDEPCRSDAFSRLLCSAIVRRLQQACGLTCACKYSVDGDEVIVCVRADANDLRTEADRQNYRLQTKNNPFAPVPEGAVTEVEFLSSFQKENPEAARECKKQVQRTCDDSLDPLLDPGLFRRGWQPVLESKLSKWRHDETFTDPHGVYFSPYIDVQEEDTHLHPVLRHYTDRRGDVTEFRTVDRIRLITAIISRHLNLESLKCSKVLIDCFALHEQDRLAHLRRNWVFDWGRHPLWGGRDQPLWDIRNYFGEKIALYFAWMEHYTKWLIFPAVAGVLFFGLTRVAGEGFVKYVLLIGFGCVVTVWATAMTETWKRRNATINLWWGTADHHVREVARPQFTGTLRYSPTTDKPEMFHNSVAKMKRRVGVTMAFVVTLILGAVVMTFYCLQLKNALSAPERLGTQGPLVGGLICTSWIVGGNMIYRLLAVRLTNWENHRTDTEWDRYMVTKTFLFRFFNSFASFFYIAYIKKPFENHCNTDKDGVVLKLPSGEDDCPGCGNRYLPQDCMAELWLQLIVVFVVGVMSGNLAECCTPFMKYKQRVIKDWVSHKMQSKNHDPESGRRVAHKIEYEQPEFEAKLEPYLEWKYSFDDYSEMVLQYGYVVLFVAANPLTPALALFNNIIEFHVDSYKLVCIHRRPWPYAASDIGQWAVFMDLLSSISVVTNLGVVIVTSDVFTKHWPMSVTSRFFIFMVAEHLLLSIKWAIAEIIPDTPLWVSHLHRRHDFITQRLKGLTSTHDDDLHEEAEVVDVMLHDNSFRFSEPLSDTAKRRGGAASSTSTTGPSRGPTKKSDGDLVATPKFKKGGGNKVVV
eukprot:g7502.t1